MRFWLVVLVCVHASVFAATSGILENVGSRAVGVQSAQGRVRTCDLNHDGYPDAIVMNGSGHDLQHFSQ